MEFLCGTYFKHQCRHQFTDYIDARQCELTYKEDKSLDNNLIFCRPEFIRNIKVEDREFELVLHNSDVNFGQTEVEYIFSLFPNLQKLYTQNLLVKHPSAKPIPIGIANPKWSHGNQDRFTKIIKENNSKNNLVYANFNISTNPEERSYCYQQIGSSSLIQYPNSASIKDHDNFVESTQENYLRDISRSYFTARRERQRLPQNLGSNLHEVRSHSDRLLFCQSISRYRNTHPDYQRLVAI
jgi:hypothetical protein